MTVLQSLDPTARQCLLEVLDTCVSDLRVVQLQEMELRQLFEVSIPASLTLVFCRYTV